MLDMWWALDMYSTVYETTVDVSLDNTLSMDIRTYVEEHVVLSRYEYHSVVLRNTW